MAKITEAINILKQIYKNKKYYYLTFVVAVVSFIVFYKLMLAKIADNSLKIFNDKFSPDIWKKNFRKILE